MGTLLSDSTTMLLETEVLLDWLLCILHRSWSMCSLKEFHKGVLKQLRVFKVLYFSLRQKFTRLFVWKERKTPLNLSILTHQKEWNGPSSKRHSLRCPWRCMLGVTRSMPYNLSNFLQNSIKCLSPSSMSSSVRIFFPKRLQARTKWRQHSGWSSGRTPLRANKE